MTNGEKIIAILKPIKDQIRIYGNWVEIEIQKLGINFSCELEWWNTECNEPSNKSIIYKAKESKEIQEDLDKLRKLNEPTTKNDLALIHTEGLDEGIRCAMCTNHMKSDRGCDGGCIVNTKMYNKVMTEINSRLLRKIPKEGYWKVVSDGYGDNAYICECSECKDTVWVYKDADRKWNYCPNCGAQMIEPWESEE